MTLFERYTERARQVIVLAQDEARAFKHNYIGTEHILLGLLREEEGIGARVLGVLDLTVDDVRRDIERIVGLGDEALPGQIPFTPRAKKVLEFGLREALALGHNYIGTEHILLGLVRENDGVAGRILGEREITPDAIRAEVGRMLSGRRARGPIDQNEFLVWLDHTINALVSLVQLAQYREETLGGQRTVENLGAQVLAIDGLNADVLAGVEQSLRGFRAELKKQQAA